VFFASVRNTITTTTTTTPLLNPILPPSNTAIMTEYVKVEKVIPKFPPPAFSDIAKASNDVCLGTHTSY
jgi:hypothetical protein